MRGFVFAFLCCCKREWASVFLSVFVLICLGLQCYICDLRTRWSARACVRDCECLCMGGVLCASVRYCLVQR